MAAARIWNNGEGGSNTTTVTTANSGANSGNAWQLVTIGTGSTLTYDNTHAAHGTLAYKFVNGAAAKSFVEWTTTFGTQTTFWGRVYVYFTANPTNPVTVFQAATTGTQRCAVGINQNGTVAIYGSGAVISSTTTAIALNQWVRIEFTFTLSTTVGTGTVNLYNTPNGFTSTDTVSVSGQNFGSTSAAQWNFGITNSPAASNTYWIDSINLNTDGFPGPDFLEQSNTGNGSTNPLALAFANNNTAGNMIVVVTSARTANNVGDLTISDSQGNTYTNKAQLFSSGSFLFNFWYAFNIKAGANTVNIGNTNAVTTALIIREYSGVTTADPLDKSVTATDFTSTSTAVASGNTATTTQAQEIIIGAFSDGSDTQNGVATDTNYNNLTSNVVISAGGVFIEDRVVNATGTYSVNATLTAAQNWGAVIATFKIATAVSTTPVGKLYGTETSPTSTTLQAINRAGTF